MPAFHIPGYNYCGPGTWDFTKKPTNALDRACRAHDISYRKLYYRNGKKVHPYFYYVYSDEVLRKRARKIGGVSGNFVYSVFSAKKLVAPKAHELPKIIRSDNEQKQRDTIKGNLKPLYIQPEKVGNKLPVFINSPQFTGRLTESGFIEKSTKVFKN